MRKLLIVAMTILAFSCGYDDVNVTQIEDELNFNQVDLGDLSIHDGGLYGGTLNRFGDNDWMFESHTNISCSGVLRGLCRKSDVVAREGVTIAGRITKYTFMLNVMESCDAGSYTDYCAIIFQDWVRVYEGGGNHPITTLKLRHVDGVLNLCGTDNSWQFGFGDPGHVPDGSVHNHPKNTINGCGEIYIGVFHRINLVIHDDGRVILRIDNRLIFDKEYQTKHEKNPHVFSWGLYWSKGYNLEIDPLKRILITIDDFTKWVAD